MSAIRIATLLPCFSDSVSLYLSSCMQLLHVASERLCSERGVAVLDLVGVKRR
jgi:hypothetical protein